LAFLSDILQIYRFRYLILIGALLIKKPDGMIREALSRSTTNMFTSSGGASSRVFSNQERCEEHVIEICGNLRKPDSVSALTLFL
jgi:hypothetical protein